MAKKVVKQSKKRPVVTARDLVDMNRELRHADVNVGELLMMADVMREKIEAAPQTARTRAAVDFLDSLIEVGETIENAIGETADLVSKLRRFARTEKKS